MICFSFWFLISHQIHHHHHLFDRKTSTVWHSFKHRHFDRSFAPCIQRIPTHNTTTMIIIQQTSTPPIFFYYYNNMQMSTDNEKINRNKNSARFLNPLFQSKFKTRFLCLHMQQLLNNLFNNAIKCSQSIPNIMISL